jgi:hypothetical protein
MRRRIYPTKDGFSSLLYFDGATMNKYKYPSRFMEVLFCRNPILPQSCSTSHAFRPADSSASPSVTGFIELELKGKACPPLELPEMKLLRLEAVVQSIFVEPFTEKTLSESGKICGFRQCKNRNLLTTVEKFGIHGSKVSFCLGADVSFVLYRQFDPFLSLLYRAPSFLHTLL